MTDFSIEEREEADWLNDEVEVVAENIKIGEQLISSNWVKLGTLVHKIRQKKYWEYFGYHSFGSYVANLEPKINKKRSQVYLCIGVAEALTPHIHEEQLVEMGISKANELSKYTKQSGKLVPDDLLASALNPDKDVEEIRSEVAALLHSTVIEKGKWYDIGGFYVSDEEKQLIEDTIELAKRIDPVISHELPEHAQRKEVILRFVYEFQATYAGAG